MRRIGLCLVGLLAGVACGTDGDGGPASRRTQSLGDLADGGGSAGPNADITRPAAVGARATSVNVSPSEGALSVSMAFPSLPARAGLDAGLSLHHGGYGYETGAGFGVGMQLSVPSMALSNDYGVPLPRAESSAGDPFYSRVLLSGSRLVYVGPVAESGRPAGVEYRLDASESVTQVVYYATDTTIDVVGGSLTFRGFLVRRANGSAEIYSATETETEGDSYKSSDGKRMIYSPTRFPLRYQIGANRDYIEYTYVKQDDGRVYLTGVSQAGGRSRYELTLERAPRTNGRADYAAGFEQRSEYLYTKLAGYSDGVAVHRWYFVYRSSDGASSELFTHAEARARASAEFEVGTAAGSARNEMMGIVRVGSGSGAVEESTLRLPTVRFGYTATSLERLKQQTSVKTVDVGRVSGFGPDHGSEFVDTNDDGLPDVVRRSDLDTATSVTRNRGDLQQRDLLAPAADLSVQRAGVPGTMAPNFRDSASSVWLQGDFDGDGRLDLLQVERATSGTKPSKLWLYPGQADEQRPFGAAGTSFASNIGIDRFSRGRAQVVDVNGDGRDDIVMATATGTTPKWTMLVNATKSGGGSLSFNEVDRILEHPGRLGTDVSLENTMNRFADINGDGLVDLVVVQGMTSGDKGLCVYENKGKLRANVDQNQLWAKDLLPFGNAAELHASCGKGYFLPISGITSIYNINAMWLVDVDGDGLLDLVDGGANSSRLRVWLGRGRKGFLYAGELPLEQAIKVDPFNRWNTRVLDFDGDGASEIVVFEKGESGNVLKVIDFNRAGLKNLVGMSLLTTISEGRGIRHAVQYASSTDEYLRDLRQNRAGTRGLAHVRPVVKRLITEISGRPAGVIEFRYHDPVMNRVERGLLGYGQVERVVYGDADQPSSVVRTTFELTGQRYRDRYLAGRVRQSEVYALATDWPAQKSPSYRIDALTADDLSQTTETWSEPALPIGTMLSAETNSWSLDREPTGLASASYVRLAQSSSETFGPGCDATRYAAGACPSSRQNTVLVYDACNRPTDVLSSSPGVPGPSGTTVPAISLQTTTAYVRACDVAAAPAASNVDWTQVESTAVSSNGQELSRTSFEYTTDSPLPAKVTKSAVTDTSSLPASLTGEVPSSTQQEISRTYDEYGNVLDERDRVGLLARYVYDEAKIRWIARSNALGHTERRAFQAGEIGPVTLQSPQGYVQTMAYDALHRLVRATGPAGGDVEYEYRETDRSAYRAVLGTRRDPSGRSVSRLWIDRADGQPMATFAADESGGSRITDLVQFGLRGLPIRSRHPLTVQDAPDRVFQLGVVPAQVGDESGGPPSWAYERCGEGTVACLGADALGRPVREQDASGRSVRTTTHHAWGASIRTDLAEGAQSTSTVGRGATIYAVIDEMGAVTQFDRDALGRMKGLRLPGQQTTRAVIMDGRGAIVGTHIPNGVTRTWERDERGRAVRQKTWNVQLNAWEAIDFSYDSLDRLVMSTSTTSSTTEPLDTTTWQYDAAENADATELGRMVRASTYDSLLHRTFVEDFRHDVQGHIVSRKVHYSDDAGTSHRSYVEGWSYTPDGLLLSYQDPFTNRLDYHYGSSSRLRGIQWTGRAGTRPLVDQLAYDERGNPTGWTMPGVQMSRTLGYDLASGWLTQMRTCRDGDGTHCVQDTRWTRAGDGRITSTQTLEETASYVYSPRGELTNATTGAQSYEYGYSSSGQVTRFGEASVPTFTSSNGLLSLPEGGSVQLDGFGRVVATEKVQSIAYDPAGRIRRAVVDGKTIAYGYAAGGERVSRVVLGESSEVIYPTKLTRDDGLARQSLMRLGVHRIGLVVDEERLLGVVDNNLGVVSSVMDRDGTLLGSWTTSPYGLATAKVPPSAALGNPELIHGFTGQYRDEDTGFIHMGARDYLPEIGAFTSADPVFMVDPEACVRSPRECNLYEYVAGDPINAVDPEGTVKAEMVSKTMFGSHAFKIKARNPQKTAVVLLADRDPAMNHSVDVAEVALTWQRGGTSAPIVVGYHASSNELVPLAGSGANRRYGSPARNLLHGVEELLVYTHGEPGSFKMGAAMMDADMGAAEFERLVTNAGFDIGQARTAFSTDADHVPIAFLGCNNGTKPTGGASVVSEVSTSMSLGVLGPQAAPTFLGAAANLFTGRKGESFGHFRNKEIIEHVDYGGMAVVR